MANLLSHESTILIIGAGTWGCSTALHLARRGYKSITVLDIHPVPSPISAGNDINKILELGSFAGNDEDEVYVSNKLLAAATEGWLNDPVFKDYFHETGCILAATSEDARAHMNSRDGPSEAKGWIPLKNMDDFRATMPRDVLTGDFPGWDGWWKKTGAGWVHARKSIESAAREASRLGVTFITGPGAGNVWGLIYENSDVKGAITFDGTQHLADRTILCAGANAGRLLDMNDQLRPTAWTLAHIRMTPEEAQLYKNLPVLFNIELGFFKEPDEDNHELKICDEHPGYCNWRPGTPNREFLISKHPNYPSLVLGVGGSGHGFAHIPAIGGFITDSMEDKLDEKMKNSFRWRPETVVGRNWDDLQGRYGPQGSNRVMDFQTISGWTNICSSTE
ncbi:uncharacterized protein A1O9_06984 [Exophiala aquamarina CBS 119918]|uniref:FAD dependent oxidoreductase domain-containing protein n=1 Tax=Exophiala aquamarina CBS 119918 TaxID=1182545 RepID=A0A072P9N5_9EURO|nr:uncharacterized protein A1O9_06984 [Exophiala aquamarina CBS 119918]KEF56794.1 hypothetical protein A1O9_06984 [Exophiala aquamarina CBS 119918]